MWFVTKTAALDSDNDAHVPLWNLRVLISKGPPTICKDAYRHDLPGELLIERRLIFLNDDIDSIIIFLSFLTINKMAAVSFLPMPDKMIVTHSKNVIIQELVP